MSNKKYTPGPWKHVDRYQDTAGDIVDKDNFSFVDVCNHSIKMDTPDDEHWANSKDYHRELSAEEQKANANLIAAAPELLEALELARDKRPVECSCGLDLENEKVLSVINAAIDKAHGKTP